MHLSFPTLLCLIVGSGIFFLIFLYYIVRFSVRDGILDADKRMIRQTRDDSHA